MKKFIALLLVAVMCLGLVPMASAADNLTQQQKAVVETALAYYYHNPNIQYDSDPITVMGKYTDLLGDIRSTDYTSPEMAVESDIMYSVCTMFCFETYYDAFHYQIGGSPITSKTSNINKMEDENVVYRWVQKDATITREQACAEIRNVLQPGDVINGGSPSGHAMLYVGDILGDGTDYILHCAGKKFDAQTGIDQVEEKGAIRLDPVDSYVLDAAKGLICKSAYTYLTILRPLNEINAKPSQYPMTESAKGRLKYPSLVIDRQASHNKFTDVEEGGEITVNIKLANKSKGDYTVPVTEVIPANASLKAGSVTQSGSVSGSNITWSVSLKAGEEKTLSYTVTATGKRGETIDLTGGNVGGIKANSIPVKIGGKHLSAEQVAKLADITNNKALFRDQTYSDTEFGEAVYQNLLGIAVDIPTSSEMLSNLYTRQRLEGATTMMYVAKEEVPADFAVKAAMQVPYYFGGQMIRTGGSGSRDRILDFKDYQLVPGDVLVRRVTGKSAECYVVVDEGKLAYMDGGSLKTRSAGSWLVKNLIFDYFVLLRPTLAFDDINTEVKLPFTDVGTSDWFYSFVKEMHQAGVINGMTATTFVPNGNLTYGQALKLIAVGLGEGEQAATSDHWAGGYLALAKTKGWISGDVDLNANITRLEFCKIAAKAKGLTEQPASNPFNDTADTSVLALVNAGVINGMSANTFAPNGLLTRAQIAKIISLLVKL